MSDLWERLEKARLRGARPTAVTEPVEAVEAPQGWIWTTPLVAERRLSFALEPGFWKSVAGTIDLEEWRSVLCFDTETTGLSGGAGTVPFLIGWASMTPGPEGIPTVEVRQWFLRDLPGEADLVAAVNAALEEARALVSFNGASFDLPLLRSRWALAGKQFPGIVHRDDLHPARRLWKRLLDSCRLSRLEEMVLGIHRIDDVPGSLVPALWFDYLRSGAGADFVSPLEGVLRHHAQDVYSLLCLDLVLASIARNPDHSRWHPTFGAFPHRPSIARPIGNGLLHPDLGGHTPIDFWGQLTLKSSGSADQLLEEAWLEEPTESVGLVWADRLKRRQDARAKELWAWLWKTKTSYTALEELLKWLEHKERTPEAKKEAVALIEVALKAPFLPRAWREGLEKRQTRLLRAVRP